MTGILGQSSFWIPALGRRIGFLAKPLTEYVRETLVQFSADFEVNDGNVGRSYAEPLVSNTQVMILAMAETYDRVSSDFRYHFLVLRLHKDGISYERIGHLNLYASNGFSWSQLPLGGMKSITIT
jgi:hypothetical protein